MGQSATIDILLMAKMSRTLVFLHVTCTFPFHSLFSSSWNPMRWYKRLFCDYFPNCWTWMWPIAYWTRRT